MNKYFNKLLTWLEKLYSQKRTQNNGCCTASIKRFENDKKYN
ncbi:hypothetical protein FHS70_001688 [Flammeovirga yaeyamensis]|nr:hypothetical protein [Flammeovirga yaeyamensis]